MGGGERVVDIEVAELGELFHKRRIVLLLAFMEAGVLQQQHVAVLHFGDRSRGRLANAVGGEGDRALHDVGDRRGDGFKRIGLVRPALGPPEMREENDLAALARDLLDGRRDALDAGRIGDAAVLGRNVEVDAQEDALAGEVGVVERAEWIAHECVAFKSAKTMAVPAAHGRNEGDRELEEGRHGAQLAFHTGNPRIQIGKLGRYVPYRRLEPLKSRVDAIHLHNDLSERALEIENALLKRRTVRAPRSPCSIIDKLYNHTAELPRFSRRYQSNHMFFLEPTTFADQLDNTIVCVRRNARN